MKKITQAITDPTGIWLKKALHANNEEPRHYRRIFRKFTVWAETTPTEIMKEWRNVRYNYKERDKFLNQIQELIEVYYATQLEDYAPNSKKKMLAVLTSFFHHMKVPVEVDIEDKYYVKYHNRSIRKEEIRRVLDHSSLRDKTFFLMMLETGQRPNTLTQLRYKHIKEDFVAERIPMKIDLPAELLKDRVGNRFCFVGEDGFKTLKEFLSPRLPMKEDDLIFVPDRPGRMKGDYLSTQAFSNSFRRKVDKLGVCEERLKGKPGRVRLYNLRKYFRNNIKVGDFGFREFWMGHKWGTDENYLTRDVEEHRKEYGEAYPSLRIYESTKTEAIKALEAEVERLKTAYNKEVKQRHTREEAVQTQTTALEKLLERVEKLEKKLTEK